MGPSPMHRGCTGEGSITPSVYERGITKQKVLPLLLCCTSRYEEGRPAGGELLFSAHCCLFRKKGMGEVSINAELQ